VLAQLPRRCNTGSVGAHGERGLSACTESGFDHRLDYQNVGHATVCHPRLLAGDHPLIGRFIVFGGGQHVRHVGAGLWLRRTERAQLDVLVGAITPRHPFRDLLGGARSDDANGSERASHDRHRYSGVTPEQLLGQDRKTLSGWVSQERHQYLVAVKPDTGGLLQDRPWRLLAVVPVERSRANHL
jgi:hypothetical protein